MQDIRLLIVDDDPELSDLVRRKLQIEAPHFTIATVANGNECLDYLRENSVDCILSDYQMPGMSGIELLRRLRESGDDTPFIFITGQGNEEVAREAFKAGAWDYFTKEAGFAHFTKITNSVEQAVKSCDAEKSRLMVEEALRQSEERMFKAQRMAHVGNWEWNIPENSLYWSDEVYRIYGLDPETFVPTFEAVGAAMYPDDLQPFLDAVKAAIEDRAHFELDYRLVRPDGEVRTVHTIGAVTFDPDGNPILKSGTVQDITEQKKAQESLLLFSNLINQSEDMISVNEPETGRILFANDKHCTNLGYERDELLKLRTIDIEDIFPDQAAWDAHVDEVRSKGNLILEGMNRRSDGTSFPVEVNVTYMSVGEKDYMVAVLRDISLRKKAEEALRQSEARLAEAEIVAKVGSWEWLVEENRVTRSDGLLKIFGLKRGEMEDTFEAYLGRVHPDDREHVREIGRRGAETGEYMPYEVRVVRPDGAERIIQVNGGISFTDDGRPHRIFGTVQDITERRHLEKQKEDLLSMLKHDMITPLSVIAGNAQMLLDDREPPRTDRCLKSLNSIIMNAGNLTSMVSDLSLIAQLESVGMASRQEKVDIADLLLEASVNATGATVKGEYTLTRSVDNGLPLVRGDQSYLKRAVANLIENAVKYSAPGTCINLCAKCSTCGTGEEVVISVSDNGPGICRDDIDKVFTKHYRSSSANGTAGSGLGLAIVKGVAEAHGGRVELESEEGKGSTFSIYLPVGTQTQ